MNMYYQKVCVRIYLLISLETTILAVFWRLTVFIIGLPQRLPISFNTSWKLLVLENANWAAKHLLDRTTIIKKIKSDNICYHV